MTHVTHEVLNQSTPFVDVNLFESDAGLRDAGHSHDIVDLHAIGFDPVDLDTLAARTQRDAGRQ